MMDLMHIDVSAFEVFLLVLCRVAGIFSTMPVFSNNSIPVSFKAGLSLCTAAVVFPTVPPASAPFVSALALAVALAREVLAGVAIGFTATFVFASIQFAGYIITRQMGLDMSTALDPFLDVEVSAIGHLKLMLASIIFLVINGHHWIIGAAVSSFSAVPPGCPVLGPQMADKFIRMTAEVFSQGLRIAAPVFFTLCLTTFLVGLVERVVPQLHVMSFGFPFMIVVGLSLMVVFAPVFVQLFSSLFSVMKEDVLQVTGMLKG